LTSIASASRIACSRSLPSGTDLKPARYKLADGDQ
jgi:hypothetical protein